jgi:hypothetical protein
VSVVLLNNAECGLALTQPLYIASYDTKYGSGKSFGEHKSLKLYKFTILVTLSVLISLTLFNSAADGITGNFKPDSTPYVGVVVLFSDSARTNPIGYCSGVLVSPTVMLTAQSRMAKSFTLPARSSTLEHP